MLLKVNKTAGPGEIAFAKKGHDRSGLFCYMPDMVSSPAVHSPRPHREALRAQAGLSRLPHLMKRVEALEERTAKVPPTGE